MSEQANALNGVPEAVMGDIEHISVKIGKAIDGEPIGPVISALLIVAGNMISNGPFDVQTKKSGVLFMASLVAKLSDDLGLTDEEIVGAFVGAYQQADKNAEAQSE